MLLGKLLEHISNYEHINVITPDDEVFSGNKEDFDYDEISNSSVIEIWSDYRYDDYDECLSYLVIRIHLRMETDGVALYD